MRSVKASAGLMAPRPASPASLLSPGTAPHIHSAPSAAPPHPGTLSHLCPQPPPPARPCPSLLFSSEPTGLLDGHVCIWSLAVCTILLVLMAVHSVSLTSTCVAVGTKSVIIRLLVDVRSQTQGGEETRARSLMAWGGEGPRTEMEPP